MTAQNYLLHALEILINDHKEIYTKIFLEILYKFYHENIIEENTFIIRYQQPSKCYTDEKIQKMVDEFIQWLNKSDDEDETESESEVIYLVLMNIFNDVRRY